MGDDSSIVKIPRLENNWQSTKRTAVSRLAFMLDNQILTDIHFMVGEEEERISAHQFVLSMSSSVFFTMFNGSVQLSEDTVPLPDIEPQALRSVLKYIYTEVVELDTSSVMSTLYAAKKYDLPGLEEACEKFIQEKISAENAFSLLAQAKFFDKPKLVDLCLSTIDAAAQQSFKSGGFTDIDQELLCQVLKRDTLEMREIELFEAVVRWSVVECKRQGVETTPENQRSVLKKALFMIRFPAMTAEEFSNGPLTSGLLTKDEIIDIFVHLSVKDKPASVFPTNPRGPADIKLKRFTTVRPYRSYYDHPVSETMRFRTDRAITLRSLGLYGASTSSSVTFSGTLNITPSNGARTVVTNFTFTSVGSTASNPFVFCVNLPKLIKIPPNKWYTVAINLDVNDYDCLFGLNGSSEITSGHPPNAVKFRFCTGYDYSGGIIAEMTFSIDT